MYDNELDEVRVLAEKLGYKLVPMVVSSSLTWTTKKPSEICGLTVKARFLRKHEKGIFIFWKGESK